MAILFVSVQSRLYDNDYFPRKNSLLDRRFLNRNPGGVSTVTYTWRETQTNTINHVLSGPTSIVEGLAGFLTGRIGGPELTDQYNDRNRMGLRGGSRGLHNNNGPTYGVVGSNYDRLWLHQNKMLINDIILFAVSTIMNLKSFNILNKQWYLYP